MCFDLKTREHKNNIFSFAFKEIKINLLNRWYEKKLLFAIMS